MSNSRRRAVVLLKPEIFLEFCKSGKKTLTVKSDIPMDAVFEGVEYSPSRDVWILAFSSPELPKIPYNTILPELPPVEITVHNEV